MFAKATCIINSVGWSWCELP